MSGQMPRVASISVSNDNGLQSEVGQGATGTTARW
jgi:hypothetical protein